MAFANERAVPYPSVMPRYILRARTGTREQLEASLKAHPDIQIVEESSPRMLLVEAEEAVVQQVRTESPGWVAVPEVEVKLPDNQVRLAKRKG